MPPSGASSSCEQARVRSNVTRPRSRRAAAALQLNCQGFLDSCGGVQFAVLEDVLQVQRDVLLRGIEELGHFQLREPDGLLLRPQLDLGSTVVRGVENQVGHGGGAGYAKRRTRSTGVQAGGVKVGRARVHQLAHSNQNRPRVTRVITAVTYRLQPVAVANRAVQFDGFGAVGDVFTHGEAAGAAGEGVEHA